ncbi:UNVERIFIED_CONTAM: hypothetical protein PYX00_005844 [Menopon gallinae]|uniref:Uncharacterized protein n=1 Tax=Menopon gallinae TaxID=328185 RepID=A0AAW2HUA6_9NEOP
MAHDCPVAFADGGNQPPDSEGPQELDAGIRTGRRKRAAAAERGHRKRIQRAVTDRPELEEPEVELRLRHRNSARRRLGVVRGLGGRREPTGAGERTTDPPRPADSRR